MEVLGEAGSVDIPYETVNFAKMQPRNCSSSRSDRDEGLLADCEENPSRLKTRATKTRTRIEDVNRAG